MYGTIESLPDGRTCLRFRRELLHPQEVVWRAVTEPEGLAAWFPTTIEGDRAPGASLRLEFRDGKGPSLDGQVRSFEPPTLFEFTWGDDVIVLELRPSATGTILTLSHIFAERGKAARDAAGWHAVLDSLESSLSRREPSETHMDTWNRVYPQYVAQFGPEAATEGAARRE